MDLCESNSACDRHMLWAEVSPRRRLLMPSQCWLHVRHDIRKIFGNRALGRSQTARYHPTPTPPAPPLNKLVKGWFPGVPMAVYQCTFWVVPCILLAPSSVSYHSLLLRFYHYPQLFQLLRFVISRPPFRFIMYLMTFIVSYFVFSQFIVSSLPF